MSKYKFKITYRNEDKYGYYWGDKRYTVSIIAETLKQAKKKLDEIEKDDFGMHKHILEWEAEEIMAQLSTEKEELQQRNDKAIEYIEDMQKAPSYCDTWSTTAPHDIICILKGSDKK